jgi:hypothetical protein
MVRSESLATPSPGVVFFVGLINLAIAYNLLHRHAAAIILMGLCRSFIVFGCSAITLGDHFFIDLSNGDL